MLAIADLGARLIALGEPDYPPWLAEIDTAPPLITVLGDSAILHKPMVAIVGSRNASVSGRKIAAKLARDLGATRPRHRLRPCPRHRCRRA